MEQTMIFCSKFVEHDALPTTVSPHNISSLNFLINVKYTIRIPYVVMHHRYFFYPGIPFSLLNLHDKFDLLFLPIRM